MLMLRMKLPVINFYLIESLLDTSLKGSSPTEKYPSKPFGSD